MAHAVRHIIAAANSALGDDEDDFERVVSQTRQSFRRRNQQTPKRGRRSCGIYKRKVLLLRRSNADYCPIRTECDMLTTCGLGYSEIEPKFQLHWCLEEMENYICTLFPKVPLQLVGFKLAKMDRQKKIIYIDVNNVEHLRENIGQSQIVIVPNRDLPITTPGNIDMQCEFPATTVELIPQTVEPIRLRPSTQQGQMILVQPAAEQTSNVTVMTRRQRNTNNIAQDDIDPISDNHDYFYDDDTNIDGASDILDVIPKMDSSAEYLEITIKRATCVRQMLDYYKDTSITNYILRVSFEDELGVDGGGLTKELFSLFFTGVEPLYFQGEDCLVPFLPLNRIRKDKSNFTIIGRILEHMLLLTGSVPSKLSKITLMLLADANKEIQKSYLVDEFYNFVNPCERLILKKSINDFHSLKTKEKELLANIFNSYHFYEMPSNNEIFEQIASIALNTLIEAPKQLIEAMRNGIHIEKYECFWKRCDFATLLDMQKPTSSKVANSLQTNENLTNEQSNTLHFLEMYIRCLHDDKIGQFVFLVTGSYQMPDFIFVEFNNLVGLSQRPTFSTCTNTIHVPSTYNNYKELKQDFDLCLCSEEAYVFTTW